MEKENMNQFVIPETEGNRQSSRFAFCRHPEFISGSSRFNGKDKMLKPIDWTPHYNLAGRRPAVEATVHQHDVVGVRAFTLIELLVVVLIIGILAAVAVPQYMRAVEKSRAMQAVAMVKIIGDAQEIYYMANGEYADNFNDLGIDVPGTDDNSTGWKRKRDAHFDFGTKSFVSVNIIAVSNRISNWEPRVGAKYYIVRFAKDNNLYCHEGSEGDDGLCKSLSGGEKKTIEDKSFYVIH